MYAFENEQKSMCRCMLGTADNMSESVQAANRRQACIDAHSPIQHQYHTCFA